MTTSVKPQFTACFVSRYYQQLQAAGHTVLHRLHQTLATSSTEDQLDLRFDDINAGRPLNQQEREDIIHDCIVRIMQSKSFEDWLSANPQVNPINIWKKVVKDRGYDVLRNHNRAITTSTEKAVELADKQEYNDSCEAGSAEGYQARLQDYARLLQLATLLEQGISQKDIAKLLKVTTRTIRNDMHKLASILTSYRSDNEELPEVPNISKKHVPCLPLATLVVADNAQAGKRLRLRNGSALQYVCDQTPCIATVSYTDEELSRMYPRYTNTWVKPPTTTVLVKNS